MSWFNITLPWNGNSKYVKKDDCHRAQDGLKEYIREKIDTTEKHINQRLDDIKDLIESKHK